MSTMSFLDKKNLICMKLGPKNKICNGHDLHNVRTYGWSDNVFILFLSC